MLDSAPYLLTLDPAFYLMTLNLAPHHMTLDSVPHPLAAPMTNDKKINVLNTLIHMDKTVCNK